jgi:transcriptional regulator with XRE-family HTH domain
MTETFGRVVAVLRAERHGEDGRRWTQERLGEATGLGVHIIRKVEQGKRTPDRDVISWLNDALQLTLWERRELAVLALDDLPASPAAEPGAGEREGRRQLDLLASLSLPAFLYDDFGDLVAANKMATWLVGLSRQALEADASWQDARFHTMRVICDPALGYAELLGDAWPPIAMRQMQIFRRISLKQRASPHLAARLKELQGLPAFRQLWEGATTAEDWPDSGFVEYVHPYPPTGQSMRYLGLPTHHLTPWGDLVLGLFVPLEADTAAVFADLAQGNEVAVLADWPK